MAITLICIGIPVCRPLYKRAFRRIFGETSSAGYHKQSGGVDGNGNSNSVPLRTIGGGLVGADGKPVVGGGSSGRRGGGSTAGLHTGSNITTCVDREGEGSDGISFSEVKLGVNGPFTRTTVGRGRRGSVDNTSDEEILGEEFRRSQVQRRSEEERESTVTSAGRNVRTGHGQQGIMVTETYRVERS